MINDAVRNLEFQIQERICNILFDNHWVKTFFVNLFEDFLNHQGLDSFLHLLASSSLTSLMGLRQSRRCQWQDGLRSLRTLALSSSAVASMTTRPAPLVTTASRCWLLLILKRRPRSCQQSSPTAGWPWWLSSACSSRTDKQQPRPRMTACTCTKPCGVLQCWLGFSRYMRIDFANIITIQVSSYTIYCNRIYVTM